MLFLSNNDYVCVRAYVYIHMRMYSYEQFMYCELFITFAHVSTTVFVKLDVVCKSFLYMLNVLVLCFISIFSVCHLSS